MSEKQSSPQNKIYQTTYTSLFYFYFHQGSYDTLFFPLQFSTTRLTNPHHHPGKQTKKRKRERNKHVRPKPRPTIAIAVATTGWSAAGSAFVGQNGVVLREGKGREGGSAGGGEEEGHRGLGE
jgi:hypothetical protein